MSATVNLYNQLCDPYITGIIFQNTKLNIKIVLNTLDKAHLLALEIVKVFPDLYNFCLSCDHDKGASIYENAFQSAIQNQLGDFFEKLPYEVTFFLENKKDAFRSFQALKSTLSTCDARCGRQMPIQKRLSDSANF